MIVNTSNCTITNDDGVMFYFVIDGLDNISYTNIRYTYPIENISLSPLNIAFLVFIKYLSPKHAVFIELRMNPLISDPIYYDRRVIQLDPLASRCPENCTLNIRTVIEVKSELFGLVFPMNTGIYWGGTADGTVGFVYHRNKVLVTFKEILPIIVSISLALLIFLTNKRKPLFTIVLINISLFLYIFVGMGIEYLIESKNIKGYLIALISQLFHRDFNHITNNIAGLLITGSIMESYTLEKDDFKQYVIYYFTPYSTLALLFCVREYHLYSVYPIGISGVICWFSTFLAYYFLRYKVIRSLSEKDYATVIFYSFLIIFLLTPIFHWLRELIRIYPHTTGYRWGEIIIHLVPSGLGVIAAVIHYRKV